MVMIVAAKFWCLLVVLWCDAKQSPSAMINDSDKTLKFICICILCHAHINLHALESCFCASAAAVFIQRTDSNRPHQPVEDCNFLPQVLSSFLSSWRFIPTEKGCWLSVGLPVCPGSSLVTLTLPSRVFRLYMEQMLSRPPQAT